MGRRTAANQIDWELIEKEFRLGQCTLRQMAATHGVQASAISRKAKKDGWVQDKSAEVKALSDAQLLISNTHKATDKATPSAVDIEVAATVRTNVVLAHRTDAQRARNLTMKLLQELETQTDGQTLLEELAELVIGKSDPDDSAAEESRQRRRAEAFERALSLSNRTKTVKDLIDSMQKLVSIEREAFGLDTAAKEQDPIASLLARVGGKSAIPVQK